MLKQDMNPRTCIVSGVQQSPDRMIRFVLGPDNQVFADLKRKLPGRGCWVSCERKLVEEAVSRKQFARSFKTNAVASEDLPHQVDMLMLSEALGMVAMAKKAGELVPGQAKAEAVLRNGDAALLLMASDAGSDGVDKMGYALRTLQVHEGISVPVFAFFSSDELDEATGGVNVMHVAVTNGGLADKLAGLLERLARYRGEMAQKAHET